MIVAIVLVALGGLLALALNVGHMMNVRAQLQNAVDAGALGGAIALDGTTDGLTLALEAATGFAELHHTDRLVVDLRDTSGSDPAGDVVLGHWDRDQPKASAFTALADPFATPREANAVLVRYGRETERGNPLDVFFGVFLGRSRASVTAEAVAVGGGACDDCTLPFVFADCIVLRADGTIDCGRELIFTSATIDNIGFTNLADGVSAVNPPTIIDILNGTCGDVSVDDEIGVGNGNNLTPNVIAALRAYIDRNGSTVVAPIIHPATCPDPQFNRLQPVVGFATFEILEVQGPPDRMLRIQLKCDVEEPDPAPGGCDFFGTPGEARLVR